jgi:hypothetical protein
VKPINSAFFMYLVVALVGGADDDELTREYFDVDPDNPVVMKNIIKSVLQPEFEKYSLKFKIKAKDCLGFYLATGKTDFERQFNANLLPIDTPKDCKLFYTWIWEAFFPNESFEQYLVNNYFEKYDINEPLCL